MSIVNSRLRLAPAHPPALTPGWIFAGGLLSLTAYCLGHGVFTSESIDLALTWRWSLGHATGVGLMAVTAGQTHGRSWLVRFITALAVGTAGSVLLAGVGLHGYASITAYVLLAALLPSLPASTTVPSWLEVDFGRSRRIVAVRDIIAVHGARNYAEIEIRGTSRPGIARTTLESMLRQHRTHLVRVHRSHLVDPRRIVEVRAASRGALAIRLCNGSEVPVSARYSAAVRALVGSVPPLADSSHSTSSGP